MNQIRSTGLFRSFQWSVGLASLAMLAACGGGNDAPAPPAVTANPLAVTAADVTTFVSAFKDASGSLDKLSSAAFADNIDDGFLDGGYTKAQLQANLVADKAAVAAAGNGIAADAAFPLVNFNAATPSQCNDTTGICQLTVTYINPAPDLTVSTDVVQVRKSGGKLRLFGDQRAS